MLFYTLRCFVCTDQVPPADTLIPWLRARHSLLCILFLGTSFVFVDNKFGFIFSYIYLISSQRVQFISDSHTHAVDFTRKWPLQKSARQTKRCIAELCLRKREIKDRKSLLVLRKLSFVAYSRHDDDQVLFRAFAISLVFPLGTHTHTCTSSTNFIFGHISSTIVAPFLFDHF